MSAEYDRFRTCWQLYRTNPTEYNCGQLKNASAMVLLMANRNGGIEYSELGPTLGSLAVTRPGWLIQFAVWIGRRWFLRGRPLWNDYEMCRWMLTRDAGLMPVLYRQVHQPDNRPVWETGHWMIVSVCEQDQDFARQWKAYKEMTGATCGEC